MKLTKITIVLIVILIIFNAYDFNLDAILGWMAALFACLTILQMEIKESAKNN